jgi:hypothetical protein
MKECPRCHKPALHDDPARNTLSLRDDKTYICNDCGDDEAFIDLGEMVPDELERDFVAKVNPAGG